MAEKSTSSAWACPSTWPEAMSWRTSFGVMAQRSPLVRTQFGCVWIVPRSTAFIAALTMIPAIPAARPTASDEQLTLGMATVIFALKFVQPLNCR